MGVIFIWFGFYHMYLSLNPGSNQPTSTTLCKGYTFLPTTTLLNHCRKYTLNFWRKELYIFFSTSPCPLLPDWLQHPFQNGSKGKKSFLDSLERSQGQNHWKIEKS